MKTPHVLGLVMLAVAIVLITSISLRQPQAHAQQPQQPQPRAQPHADALPLVNRWQIHHAELTAGVGDELQSAVNTILLDSATGQTWMLWTSFDAGEPGYLWIALPRRDEPAPGEV